MNFENLKRLQKVLEKKLTVDKDNVSEFCLKLSTIESDIILVYTKERIILEDYKAQKEQKYAQLFKEFKGKGYDGIRVGSKTEADALVHSNDDYHDLAVKVQNQQVVIDTIEKYLDTCKKIGFLLRAHVDLEKINNGIV